MRLSQCFRIIIRSASQANPTPGITRISKSITQKIQAKYKGK